MCYFPLGKKLQRPQAHLASPLDELGLGLATSWLSYSCFFFPPGDFFFFRWSFESKPMFCLLGTIYASPDRDLCLRMPMRSSCQIHQKLDFLLDGKGYNSVRS